MKTRYEEDDNHFTANAYTVRGYKGVAWYVRGWEVEPDEDTEWSGVYVRTGQVVCTMIGDDRHFTFDREDVISLDDLAYCASCGQIGCTHDGRDRE